MENNLVRYSRAGDTFHYRWAARRCLRLIHPKTQMKYVVIEGSRERKMAGEYVIDVAEYSDSPTKEGFQDVAYYQLKHTTVHKNNPFNLSDLKETFEGFSARFKEFITNTTTADKVTFTVVTNRPINQNLKDIVNSLSTGKQVKSSYTNTLSKYTQLFDEDLKKFCVCLRFADGEGDYNAQKHQLHLEVSQLIAGSIDNPELENITALVRDKALPDSDGVIFREELLAKFGVTSERDLFPAPPEFETLKNVVQREQYIALRNSILSSAEPLIIHASGGVGKTAFAREVIHTLPAGSFGVIYDCFGGGRYRNRSELRHHHRQAFVQVVNELATNGLCDPLLVNSGASETDILRKFLERVEAAVTSLKKTNSNAVLVIIIDAADNAEMAAAEFNDNCFVHELLRENLTEGVKIVALCRTERIPLLQPQSNIKQIELKPFSEKESLYYLRTNYPQSSVEDGSEFHRLTSGNPRVQSNALSLKPGKISEMFARLGNIGATVDEQIERQLMSAVDLIKDKLHDSYRNQIDSICIGLATLPPFIPLFVLAKAADVEESTIRSFVADIGRPLWLSDAAVQFRDEPTETWFRQNYAATKEHIVFYINQIKALASENSYVASALPSLLLQAGKNADLIDLALSDNFLPDNLIDKRNVRIYRLQFAFKASLKEGNYVEAIKLALRAGEEVAGDKRQMELLTNNIDLIAPLQDEQRVQEFAFRRLFGGSWRGSENIYSASLLSTVKEFKGEARSFLRAAENWLSLYFRDRDERKNEASFHHELLKNEEIMELVYTHLNVHGVEKAFEYLVGWSPPKIIYDASRQLFKRLLDRGDMSIATQFAKLGARNQHVVIAFAHESINIGHIPESDVLQTCLDLLTTRRTRIKKIQSAFQDTTLQSIISFLECCAANKLPKEKIIRVLNHYYPQTASSSITSDYNNKDRAVLMRAWALKKVSLSEFEFNINEWLPKGLQIHDRSYENEKMIREIGEVIGGLLPWHLLRARVITGNIYEIEKEIADVSKRSGSVTSSRYRDYDSLPMDIARTCCDILVFHAFAGQMSAKIFYETYIKDKRMFLPDHLKLVRSAFRLDHLNELKRDVEQYTYSVICSATDIGPDEKANYYIELARSIINVNQDDAAVYFNFAIDSVSKFGDEIVERWETVISLANRRKVNEFTSPELAYRFIRCAELVGENVVREKHWDRDEAIRTCIRMSPDAGIAALSRWRDRRVGRFNRQLIAVSEEIVDRGYVAPRVAWSFSAFMTEFEIVDFAIKCIDKEKSDDSRRFIFNSVIKELRLNGARGELWKKINYIAHKYSLQNKQLDEVNDYSQGIATIDVKTVHQEGSHQIKLGLDEKAIDWNELLHDLDLVSSNGLREAFLRYERIPWESRNKISLWCEVYKQITDHEAKKFLSELIKVDELNIYDLNNALSSIPKEWFRKVSIQVEWPKIMQSVGNRFAEHLLERGTISFFIERLYLGEENIPYIKKGIIEGLTSHRDLVHATTLFGFVKIASEFISTDEATKLLEFALSRFELHIDPDYADGPWSQWLVPPMHMKNSFTGFIWSALGSPESSTRWRAAHSVRRLADAQCSDEIDSLIEWMGKDKVEAFGADTFPFYNLNARLYLMISLARVSIDNSEILLPHSNIFYKHALQFSLHILIQKSAAAVGLNIENTLPGTYPKEVIESFKKVGMSQLDKLELERFGETRDSYWHANKKIDTSLEFYHGYDFDGYWFEPLGRAFGISSKQVEDLASDIVINQWKIELDGGHIKDPRHTMWRSSSAQESSYYHHGSYPQVYDYRFYLSYHAMLIVASKLLETMPVVYNSDGYEEEDVWNEWLHRHSLTRNDGYWLYDRRDPIPLYNRNFVNSRDPDWQEQVTDDDFLDGILCEQRDEEIWLNVFGSWEDSDSESVESYYISSSLVTIEGAQSLLNALSTCSNPHDFKLPDYEEDRMELDLEPFRLRGWIKQEEASKRLDEFDPYSSNVDFPPYTIGTSVAEKMMISADYEKREWTRVDESKPSVTCQIWTLTRDRHEDETMRQGNRFTASISFLKRLCLEFQSELIIEVQIRRRHKGKSYLRRGEADGYKQPRSKIFILSADGRLRDTETYYELREGASQ